MFRSVASRRLACVSALFLWCIALIVLQSHRSGHTSYGFLCWNLLLATVPLPASAGLKGTDFRRRPLVAAAWFALWLLFLPNAPYILTDIVHLHPERTMRYWYDVAIVLSCAGTGLLMGYLSLVDVQSTVEDRLGPAAGWSVAIGSLLLSGFGIYLGRFLSWNSWEALYHPAWLASDIARSLGNPHAGAVSAIFGVGLALGYVAFRVTATPLARPAN